MSLNAFPWPSLGEFTPAPFWNGHAFALNGKDERILSYSVEESHWSNELTSLHETEAGQNHPIDRASRRLAVASMQTIRSETPTILDVGCSSGFVLEDLRRSLPDADLIGADYLRGPLEGLARRMADIPLLQFDLRKCPLPSGCVDGITCLNVLEHIDDHEAALAEIFRILKRGGLAHIEVPAGPNLYDIYDEYLMHHRRYRLKELTQMAAKCGFKVVKATHLGCMVYPAFWWVKRTNRHKMNLPREAKAQLVSTQIRATRVSPILEMALSVETSLGNYFPYPWGIRCVTTLQK